MDAPDAGRIIRAPARRKRNDEQLMDRVSTISFGGHTYDMWKIS